MARILSDLRNEYRYGVTVAWPAPGCHSVIGFLIWGDCHRVVLSIGVK